MPTSEFAGKDDKDKTIPILPRPVLNASDKLRMMYLTGDETGNSPRDPEAWRGGVTKK